MSVPLVAFGDIYDYSFHDITKAACIYDSTNKHNKTRAVFEQVFVEKTCPTLSDLSRLCRQFRAVTKGRSISHDYQRPGLRMVSAAKKAEMVRV